MRRKAITKQITHMGGFYVYMDDREIVTKERIIDEKNT